MSEQTGGTGDAAETERQMREHEAEARERDPDERSSERGIPPEEGVGASRRDDDDTTPPGTAGRLSSSGG
jgi:hypothetical protein